MLPFPQQITAKSSSCAAGRPLFHCHQPATNVVEIAMQSLQQYAGDSAGRMKVRLGSLEKGYNNSWLSDSDNHWLASCGRPQSSIVTISPAGITVLGKDEIGMLYGVQTHPS